MSVFEAVRESGVTARQAAEKGDAIDFVAKFYGIGKKEAALQIASDFGIRYEDKRGRKPPPKRKRKLPPEQRFERAEKKCFRVLSDYLCCLRDRCQC